MRGDNKNTLKILNRVIEHFNNRLTVFALFVLAGVVLLNYITYYKIPIIPDYGQAVYFLILVMFVLVLGFFAFVAVSLLPLIFIVQDEKDKNKSALRMLLNYKEKKVFILNYISLMLAPEILTAATVCGFLYLLIDVGGFHVLSFYTQLLIATILMIIFFMLFPAIFMRLMFFLRSKMPSKNSSAEIPNQKLKSSNKRSPLAILRLAFWKHNKQCSAASEADSGFGPSPILGQADEQVVTFSAPFVWKDSFIWTISGAIGFKLLFLMMIAFLLQMGDFGFNDKSFLKFYFAFILFLSIMQAVIISLSNQFLEKEEWARLTKVIIFILGFVFFLVFPSVTNRLIYIFLEKKGLSGDKVLFLLTKTGCGALKELGIPVKEIGENACKTLSLKTVFTSSDRYYVIYPKNSIFFTSFALIKGRDVLHAPNFSHNPRFDDNDNFVDIVNSIKSINDFKYAVLGMRLGDSTRDNLYYSSGDKPVKIEKKLIASPDLAMALVSSTLMDLNKNWSAKIIPSENIRAMNGIPLSDFIKNFKRASDLNFMTYSHDTPVEQFIESLKSNRLLENITFSDYSQCMTDASSHYNLASSSPCDSKGSVTIAATLENYLDWYDKLFSDSLSFVNIRNAIYRGDVTGMHYKDLGKLFLYQDMYYTLSSDAKGSLFLAHIDPSDVSILLFVPGKLSLESPGLKLLLYRLFVDYDHAYLPGLWESGSGD